jgi:2-dehydro-3-deoxygluconokinase
VRDDEWARVGAHLVDAVVDTVGAGDGFDAGFVAGWLRGFSLERCLALAARVGAGAVAVAGDWEGYPTAREVGL